MRKDKTGEFIKILREEANISQEELAKLLYVDRSTISKWENGSRAINPSILQRLSEIFNISINELIVGEKITKENEIKINNIPLELVKEKNKLKRHLKITMLLLSALAFAFLIYFFITFYNSIKVYEISTSKSNLSGLLVKNRERLDLVIDYNFSKESKKVTLFYKENKEEKLVLATENPNLAFTDYLGYEEYFPFEKLNTILDNSYLKVEYTDGTEETYKLNFTLSYQNSRLFPKVVTKIGETLPEESQEKITPIIDLKELNKEICDGKSCGKEVKYKGVKYTIYSYNDLDALYINATLEDSSSILYSYDYINYNSFGYEKGKDNVKSESYSYTLDIKNCSFGDCSKFQEDYNLFLKIIEEAKKH